MEEVLKKPEGAGPADEKQLWQSLKSCYDPEIPVNIVDLGLIYDLQLETLPSGNSKVAVKMTLTAPGCRDGYGDRRGCAPKIALRGGRRRCGG